MVFKGNSRTKTSFSYMYIPLRIFSRAVNRLFTFEDRLVIAVEIVNDEEFMELRGATNVDYLLTYEDEGIPKIVIKESKMLIGIKEGKKYLKPGFTGREIIDFCNRGLIDVLRFMGKEPFRNDDELYLLIKVAWDKEFNAIPKL